MNERRGTEPEFEAVKKHARSGEVHDVLVFPKQKLVGASAFKLPVQPTTDTTPQGTKHRGGYYDPPEAFKLEGSGNRRAFAIARPDQRESGSTSDKEARGPAFGVLPIKPEPASTSIGTCYLIGADTVNAPNYWTVEEWNDGPGGIDYQTPEHPESFEVLLAGPRGMVFRAKFENLREWAQLAAAEAAKQALAAEVPTEAPPAASLRGVIRVLEHEGKTLAEIEALPLRHQSEIWTQLRNGCVAGRARYLEPAPTPTATRKVSSRVVPLVNVTALDPNCACEGVPVEGAPAPIESVEEVR